MARHPTSSRVHRDSKSGPDDAFVSGVDRTVAWVKQNQRALTIAIVAAIVLVAGVLYYVNYQRTLEQQAAVRFAEIQGTVAAGNVPLAIRDLQTFIGRFGSAEAGEQARIVLAELLLQENQPQQAIDALGNLDRDLDDPLGIAAAQVKAAAFEAADRHDDAVALYQRLADAARFDFQAREALANAARVRLQNDDPEAAIDLYERVLATFEEDDPGRGYYEMWLAEAQARATDAPVPPAAESAPEGAGSE